MSFKNNDGRNRAAKLSIILCVLALALFTVGCPPASESDSNSDYILAPRASAPPFVSFSADPAWGQSSLRVAFTDESISDGANQMIYFWDFGDGSISFERNPVHVYDNPGKYAVTLVAVNEAGFGRRTENDCVSVSPNDVLIWNQAAVDAAAQANWMPNKSSRLLAMVHAAMYDAINAVEQTHQPYAAGVVVPAGACKEVAAAKAAHDILSENLPAQAAFFDALLQNTLDCVPDGAWEMAGLALGDSVADAILDLRAADGSMDMYPPYTGDTVIGSWRPTPPMYMAGMFYNWQFVEPFALTSPSQFRPGPPPALDSALYATDLNEVKEWGSATSVLRTPEQSMIAEFWADMPDMNMAARQAALNRHLTMAETARLFALLNIAMADAIIAGADCKYNHSFWRPITAIREADLDGNPDTTADPAWTPYLTTPAHPEYLSNHSAVFMAAAVILRNYFGTDQANVVLESPMDPNVTRSYDTYTGIAHEASMSRIYGGIHYRFSYEGGVAMGENVANYIYANYLLPL